MAAANESTYFPPLDKCLAGEARLVSWRAAYRALCDEKSAVDNNALERFAKDPETIQILSKALDPFAAPSQQSAGQFNTKTAPINVSQANNGGCNLEELKGDAKWLSEEVKVEELVALRMAIIEWQERSADHLLSALSGGSSALASAADPASSSLAKSAFDFTASSNGTASPALDWSSEGTRRPRLLDVFLSERAHILKLGADLIGRTAVSKDQVQGQPVGALRHAHLQRSWIDDVAGTVTAGMCSLTDKDQTEEFCRQCIATLRSTLQRTDTTASWPPSLREDEVKQQSYFSFLYNQTIHTLRILLASLYALDGMPGQTLVLAWFSLMQDVRFLHEPTPVFEDMDVFTLQCLVSAISTDILKAQFAIAAIMQAAGVDAGPPIQGSKYTENEDCILSINTTLYRCVALQINVAAPAIAAWSSILSTFQDVAFRHRTLRERGIENVNDRQDRTRSRRGSRDMLSELERLYELLGSPDYEEARENPPRFFAGASIDTLSCYDLMAGYARAISATFASPPESSTAFICREIFLDLIRESLAFVSYNAQVLEGIIALLMLGSTNPASRRHDSVLAGKFLEDDAQLMPFLQTALARYPYELSPMLRLIEAVSSADSQDPLPIGQPTVVKMLNELERATQMVPEHFRTYTIDQEHEIPPVELTGPLPLFISKHELWSSSQRALTSGEQPDNKDTLTVPAGTLGVLVKESKPYVFQLGYAHSGIVYLSLLLSTFLPSSELEHTGSFDAMNRHTAAETVSMFTALLGATLKQHQGVDHAQSILKQMSSALPHGQDIALIISEILEAELLAYVEQMSQEGSLQLVIVCVEFLNVILKLAPERVWSMLARSVLLGVPNGAVALASIVGGVEVPAERFRFLKACVDLHTLLLEDAIGGLVKRKARAAKSASRFDSPVAYLESTPDRIISAVLVSYQKILLDVMQNIPDWRFAQPEEKHYTIIAILASFSKLLASTYGVDASRVTSKVSSKPLTAVLRSATRALLQACIPPTGTSPVINTVARILPEGLAVAEDVAPVHGRLMLAEQTNSLLRFMTVLIRAARSGITLPDASEKPKIAAQPPLAAKTAIVFSSDILKQMPTLAALLASDNSLKFEVFTVLTELVLTVGSGNVDPPSILGQLSAEAAKTFLEVAIQLDRPLSDINVERSAWEFMSSVMSSRQQWCAMYLLTGALSKDRAHRRDADTAKSRPLLRAVLNELSGISQLPPERAVGMLKFIATAQQTWVWATNELRSHPDFIKKTLEWLNNLSAPPREPVHAAALHSVREYEMAAYLCDILAINLHASIEIGDKTVLKALVPKLRFLTEHGVAVDAYNRSLNRSLAGNFKGRFPHSELSDFKRTPVNPAPLGKDFFYDRQFADAVLRHDVSWQGANPDKNEGFSDEFARANANRSLLHAQIMLLKSFKMLATTLCECADQEPALRAQLAKIAKACLEANASPLVEEPEVAEALQLRLELAFVLITKLNALKVQSEETRALLPAAWVLVSTSPVSYEVASAAEDVRYYRKLLQVLYLVIQPHNHAVQDNRTQLTEAQRAERRRSHSMVPACLVSIVSKVIVPGFRALCGNLHNDLQLALPADFGLLTALLQAIIGVPGIHSKYAELSDIIASSSVTRGAMSLYSWSDQLAEIMDQDPIYGELAIVFLLALSTIPPVAEQMATEGILTQLSSANLSNYFRKPGGKGPFDQPPRMFVIWTEGFLPLCLNLLDAVGPAIAAEVAAFLNSFPEQLLRADRSLLNETPSPAHPRAGSVTLGLVAEAHSLSMIAIILRSDTARAAAEGINATDVAALKYDVDGVKALVEGLSRTKRSLADRIKPSGPAEARWEQTRATGASDDLLHAKVTREIQNMLSCFEGEEGGS